MTGMAKIISHTENAICLLLRNAWGWFVQKADNATHQINYHPVDSVTCFVNSYPLESYLSGG